MLPLRKRWPATTAAQPRCATHSPPRRCCWWAAIRPTKAPRRRGTCARNVRLNGARLYIANTAEIKLRRQAKAFLQVAEYGYGALAAYLAGDDASPTQSAADSRGAGGLPRRRQGRRIAARPDRQRAARRGAEAPDRLRVDACPARSSPCYPTTPTRAAPPTWACCPTCCPATRPIGPIDTQDPASRIALEYGSPTAPGLDLLEIFDAAAAGNLSALYVVGANPVARYDVDAATLKNTFVVVQDMFLTETAALADVVLPAANLYEKSGSVTNSYGDLQQVKKAADRAGVRTDFEMIVRIADKMGADRAQAGPVWVTGNSAGIRADMGQTRGAESGEADRHAVWLTANNLEPRLSPFDPSAMLDEIQRLVPGYTTAAPATALRQRPASLACGCAANEAGLVQIATRRDLVLPANDTLFTSGSLGRYLRDASTTCNRTNPGKR